MITLFIILTVYVTVSWGYIYKNKITIYTNIPTPNDLILIISTGIWLMVTFVLCITYLP